MDALTYFFFNLGLLNFLLALVAFLLGLLLGWLLWGKFKQQINTYIDQQKKYKSEIDALKATNKQLEERLLDTAELDDLKANFENCESARIKLEADQEVDRQVISELNGKIEKVEQGSSDIAQLNEELAACKKKCADFDGERSQLQSKITSLSAASAPIAAPVADKNETRAFFSDAITSGKMREDEQYGLLYNSAPEQVDDLTKIKGVAGVLNEKLNEYGIYTYRQIALWTPQICEDFSDRLSFKGRIQRDDWIGQCKEFHKEKYQEVI